MNRVFFDDTVGSSTTSLEISVTSCPTTVVNSGSWRESADGKNIKIQQWRLLGSNMKFVCRGRWMFVKGWNFFLFIIFVAEMSSLLTMFAYFEVWKNSNPFETLVLELLHLLIGIYSIVNAFCVMLTDPGILAPGVHNPIKECFILQHLEGIATESQGVYDKMIPDRVEIAGEEVERFYCVDCHEYREFRTYHCSLCHVCIERYDHHCPMFGRCIGRRNYGYFLKFIWSISFSLVGIITYSVINLITFWIAEGFLVAASKSPTTFLLLLGFICPPCGIPYILKLSYIHFCLVWSDRTLNESRHEIKGLATPIKVQENFYQAVLERVRHVCSIICSNPPPPTIQLHKYICVKAVPWRRM